MGIEIGGWVAGWLAENLDREPQLRHLKNVPSYGQGWRDQGGTSGRNEWNIFGKGGRK